MSPASDDPRSKMTNRKHFLTRSLHTPKIVTIVACDFIDRDLVKGAEASVRKALRFLKTPDHYSVDKDPTFRAIVEAVQAHIDSKA